MKRPSQTRLHHTEDVNHCDQSFLSPVLAIILVFLPVSRLQGVWKVDLAFEDLRVQFSDGTFPKCFRHKPYNNRNSHNTSNPSAASVSQVALYFKKPIIFQEV